MVQNYKITLSHSSGEHDCRPIASCTVLWDVYNLTAKATEDGKFRTKSPKSLNGFRWNLTVGTDDYPMINLIWIWRRGWSGRISSLPRLPIRHMTSFRARICVWGYADVSPFRGSNSKKGALIGIFGINLQNIKPQYKNARLFVQTRRLTDWDVIYYAHVFHAYN